MKSKFFLTIFTAGVIFLFVSFPAFASIYTYSFDNITNTIPENVVIGKTQLSVDVTDEGVDADQVLFTFRNTGEDFCSISEVYFDDGSLLGISILIDKNNGGDDGVDFVTGANPANLPSGNNADPPFEAIAAFSSQANNPAPKKGVNPGEWLGILFELDGGNFSDVINELSTEQLRIGLHVNAFDLGESESFINNPISTPIPIPATVWMFGAGLVGLVGIRGKLVR